MAKEKKAYCESPIRRLVWVIIALSIAVVAGTFYYTRGLDLKKGRNVRNASRRDLNFNRGRMRTAVEGQPAALTSATPKGGIKLIAGMKQTTIGNIQEAFNNIAATVKPGVVHLEIMKIDPRQQNKISRMESIGSGVLVDRRGYVLTNYHVLKNAIHISVTTYSKAGSVKYEGKIVHSDIRTDLAVIKIIGGNDFPTAMIGDSSKLQVGDWVLAIGSPLNLAQTVSMGIVSGLRETIRIGGATYQDMIQTDAHINKGNSGGPLVNISGEVVGINTAIYTPDGNFTGVGFALPINKARLMLDELNIAPHRFTARVAALNKTQLQVLNKGSWLGITGDSMTAQKAANLNIPVTRGVYVVNVISRSPADMAGLQTGDIIIMVDFELVGSNDHLLSHMAKIPPGKQISIRIYRNKFTLDLRTITSAKW